MAKMKYDHGMSGGFTAYKGQVNRDMYEIGRPKGDYERKRKSKKVNVFGIPIPETKRTHAGIHPEPLPEYDANGRKIIEGPPLRRNKKKKHKVYNKIEKKSNETRKTAVEKPR